jgi:hypothetical protein
MTLDHHKVIVMKHAPSASQLDFDHEQATGVKLFYIFILTLENKLTIFALN